MCSTGERAGAADSSVVIIRAMCFLRDVEVNIVAFDSRGLFRTLFRVCAQDVYCVIVSSSSDNKLQSVLVLSNVGHDDIVIIRLLRIVTWLC